MRDPHHALRSTRRDFLKAAGFGAVAVGGALGAGLGVRAALPNDARAAIASTVSLAATDGYVTMPGREADPVYVFGFVDVSGETATVDGLIAAHKGHAGMSAPTLAFAEGQDATITLTNLGLIQRPDLTDSHTVHWHGFDIPSPLYDGVPEVSVAVPVGRQLTYFYRPHRAGTYMYHCHFEDVEHVQMGMQGIVFVTPAQDGQSKTFDGKTFTRFAYNDGDGSTGYHRHFALLLDEIWSRYHDGDRDIQETIPTDYDPEWFTINGRCYPQTILPNDDQYTSSGLTTANANTGTQDASQPNSSLIQLNAGERGLLRIANLGYQQHAMQLPGLPMRVVGQDASWLGAAGAGPYVTTTLYLGPGEARDVLIDAPAYDAARPGGTDGVGPYNVYWLRNRDWRKLSNNGAPGDGGMMTQVRVYGPGRLGAQEKVGRTYVA